MVSTDRDGEVEGREKDETDVSVEGQARLWELAVDKEGLRGADDGPDPKRLQQSKKVLMWPRRVSAGGQSRREQDQQDQADRCGGYDQYTALGLRLAGAGCRDDA